MSADMIVDRIAAERGWTPDTVVALLCEYIDNQQANDALEDFLSEVAANEENS
jgi:hypothetical protein